MQNTTDNKKAIVLLSGGIDSTTTLAIAGSLNYKLFALTFSYGQRHKEEIKAAKKAAYQYKVERHIIMKIDLGRIGGSALTSEIEVPKGRCIDEIKEAIPITYVPARNTIFLSFALAWAEVLNIRDIFIGANAVDYSGYPDCRSEFIKAFEKVANLGTKCGSTGKKIKIHAPLISLTKAQIIKRGISLAVDFSLTHSCYDPLPNGRPCRRCDSCILRSRGFKEAGINDPLLA